MGRDTIQLEDAVSTFSEEYLLEFTLEYGIPESLHLELPDLEETIVDFPEGKVGVYTKFFEFANYRIPLSQFLFDILGHYQIHFSQLSVIGAAKQAAGEEHPSVLYEAPGLPEELEQPVLLGGRENIPHCHGIAHKRPKGWDAISRLLFCGRRDDIEHTPYPYPKITRSPIMLSRAEYGEEEQTRDGLPHGIPPVQNPTTTEAILEPDPEKEVAAMGPQVNKRRRKRGNDGVNANAPPKVLRKDHVALRPTQSTLRGKSLAAMGLDVGSTLVTPATQETPSDAKTIFQKDGPSDPHLKCCYRGGVRHVLRGESGVREINFRPIHGWVAGGYLSARVGHDQQLPPGHSERVPRCGRPDSTTGDQRIQVREEEIKKLDQEIKSLKTVETEVHGLYNQARNLETLFEAEVDMKKAVEAKNVGPAKELESLRAQFVDLQVSNNQLFEQVSTLQTQVTGEERIKAAFEEFKKYEDNRVSSRCAEMDERLDALSIDFDEELYPHMLTAIAGRRWVIRHGLRLAVMKCVESRKLRQVFANVVFAGIAKGMNEGLKHGIEHGKANLDLAAIKAYDSEADTKYIKPRSNKDFESKVEDMVEEVKTKIGELFGTYKERFDFLSSNSNILAIQISTVASEAAFSTGGRVLDPYRTRLSTTIVEALICTQDWVRKSRTQINWDDVEDLIKDDEIAGLRLAVMKCAKSTELRHVFANVVSAGIAKGHTLYVAVLHALKDLKYPLVDQLEKLKDAPIDLIMASLYLESDSGEDDPQWIRELRPSSSQLKIPVYPEVRYPKDPWSFKEEILLEDVIAANISRAEKKKKCRVVCHTHGVGFAHHARSDGVPVSVPTVAPHGLTILLTDAATQTQISEHKASLRLLRSKSLPPMYNLDWP
ncbi:gypsy type transposase [Tanacetum coccineum]